MRGLVFGLLLTNILFAVWQYIPRFENVAPESEPHAVKNGLGDIVMLAEAPSESLRYFADTFESPVSASTGLPEAIQGSRPEVCIEVGPFETIQEMEAAISALPAEIAFQSESRTAAVEVEFRVYLPPLPSREIAATTLDNLRAAFALNNLAIETFLIPSGELANGIALGLFTEHSNALNVREQLRNLGYLVTLREESKVSSEHWFVSEPIDSKEYFMQLWKNSGSLAPSVVVGEKLCQTIAQETQFP